LPYLLNPGLIFLGLSFVSVLVPLIEETFKPIGVWFMSASRITPAMGFGFGVLSGAGFGLFENLGNTSSAGAGWALLAGSRISTLLLHSFTAGLFGWGLASAWSERRYLRLALSFTIAVLIHGMWNGMAVVSSAAALSSETSIHVPAGLQTLGTLATLGVFALGVLVVFAFFGFNAYLRRSIRLSDSPPPGASIGIVAPAPDPNPAQPPDLSQHNLAEESPSASPTGEELPQNKNDSPQLNSDDKSQTKSEFYP
jgi:hypothetical protein